MKPVLNRQLSLSARFGGGRRSTAINLRNICRVRMEPYCDYSFLPAREKQEDVRGK